MEKNQKIHGDFELKDLPWVDDKHTFVARRHCPRDIEVESVEFHTDLETLYLTARESSLVEVISQNDRKLPDNAGVGTQEDESEGTSGPEIGERILVVSLNDGRPKKKSVTISRGNISFRRPNGNANAEETSIPASDILLLAQRHAGTNTTGLTIFWRSPKDSPNISKKTIGSPKVYNVETAELYFDESDVLMTWKSLLGRLQESADQTTQMSYNGPKPLLFWIDALPSPQNSSEWKDFARKLLHHQDRSKKEGPVL